MPGSLPEITIIGRGFRFAADADGSTRIGGRVNEFESNGDGETGRYIQTTSSWKFSGANVVVDDENGDLEFLQEIQNMGKAVPIKIVYADGTIRAGKGNITGDIEPSSMSGTSTLSFEGPGKLQKQ